MQGKEGGRGCKVRQGWELGGRGACKGREDAGVPFSWNVFVAEIHAVVDVRCGVWMVHVDCCGWLCVNINPGCL